MKTLITKAIGFYLNLLGIFFPRVAGRKGFLLFCRPFRSRLNAKQAEFFSSAEKFDFIHDGNRVQAYRWGNGEKRVLFLHGWQSHTYRWKAYIEALPKEEYTIYAFDAPGHGLSAGNFLSLPVYSDLTERFVESIGSVHTAVAHSIGGFSLLYTFHRVPHLSIGRILLMAPPGEAKDFVDVFRKTVGISDRTLKFVMDHFAKLYDVTPEYFSAPRFAAAVPVTGLIIHDEHDDEAPYAHAVRLNDVWKKSRLLTTTGLGHNLKSPEIVKEVVNFITEPRHAHVLQD